MLESNLSYANVITGTWLPYQDYLSMTKTNVIEEFSQLNTNIEEILNLRKSQEYLSVLESNRNYILNRYNAKKSINQWLELYQ